MKRLLLLIIPLVALAGVAFAVTQIPPKDNEPQATESSQTADQQSETSDNDDSDSQNPTGTGDEAVSNENQANAASNIQIKDFQFSPSTLTVKAGTTVTWTNQDTVQHNVEPDNETNEFKAGKLLSKGESYSVTFNTPGTYTYFCMPHPNMTGTVVVTE